MDAFVFNTAPRIVSGAGSSLELAQQCLMLGVTRPLLVTDPGLVAIGLVEPVISALASAGMPPVLFDQVKEDPPEAVVLAAAELGVGEGIDGVIALGGGSSMDVAKVVAVLVGGGQTLPRTLRRGPGQRLSPATDFGADHGGNRIGGDSSGGNHHG